MDTIYKIKKEIGNKQMIEVIPKHVDVYCAGSKTDNIPWGELEKIRPDIKRAYQEELGLKTAIDKNIEAGLVVSVLYPDNPNWDFEKVHDYCYERGFTIYPGKISTTNTFRLCALGAIDEKDIEEFILVLKDAIQIYENNN